MALFRSRGRRIRTVLVTTVVALTSIAVGGGFASADPVIVAAGDIARANQPSTAQRQTARLIGRINPRAVLPLGDLQYPNGSLSDFRRSYDPTWGRFFGRTYPTPGNHEYSTSSARGYFQYFGRRAHPGQNGDYSFNLGRWHLLSINGGRGRITDSQLRWVRRNLARDGRRCELAYFHFPRWSSGSEHGSEERMGDLWRVLYRAGVDVVLNGHEHNYERFALLDPSGRPARGGIRQFVVGTGGGADLYSINRAIRGSERRIDDRYGVLRMVLHERSYEWRFVAANRNVLDRGGRACHR